jgi:DNA-binding response OmpR family regulator
MPNKILIVDDEPFNLDLLEQELQDQGYIIERAGDGAEALEKVPSFLPDVILLDYMMPNMNGLEVLGRLRKDEKHKGIPVILLTAKATQEDKIRGLDAGADDYVVKPFDAFELMARVRAMIRIKEMHDLLEDWNRDLADKVARQVEELERVKRLKRYLSPQIAETILSETKVISKATAEIRRLPRPARCTPVKAPSWRSHGSAWHQPRWASLFSNTAAPWSASPATAS